MSDLKEARRLIDMGKLPAEVSKITGVPKAVCAQFRREIKPNKVDYGCTVCSGSKKGGGKGFCSKHYYRYVTRPERIRKIKGLS